MHLEGFYGEHYLITCILSRTFHKTKQLAIITRYKFHHIRITLCVNSSLYIYLDSEEFFLFRILTF